MSELPSVPDNDLVNGGLAVQRVWRVPRRLKGCKNMRAVLAAKERDLANAFRQVHKREPTFLEQEIIEVALSHLSRACGQARLLDLDFRDISHSDKIITWEKSGNAHELYLKAILRLGLEKAAGGGLPSFQELMAMRVVPATVTKHGQKPKESSPPPAEGAA